MIAIRAAAAAVLLGGIALAGCAAPPPPAPLADDGPRRSAAPALEERFRGRSASPGWAKALRRERDCMVAPRSPIRGTMLAVDNATGIFLLSRGNKDGVYCGDEFAVTRGDLLVAMVVADKVFPDKSSVRVKWSDGVLHQLRDIRVGDRVSSPR